MVDRRAGGTGASVRASYRSSWTRLGSTLRRGPSAAVGGLRRYPTWVLSGKKNKPRHAEDGDLATPASSGSDLADGWRHRARRIVHSSAFDVGIGLVILANAVAIGIEQSLQLEGKSVEVLKWLEYVFLTVYIVELALRFVAYGCKCLRDNWVKFDCFLVLLGIFNVSILDHVVGSVDELGPLMVLRIVRLARLIRTLRLVVKIKVLWMLVLGLINSASTMLYTLVLLLIILYVFSAIGFELILDSSMKDPEYRDLAQTYFSTLPGTMLTLMQFVCMDSIGDIYRPLIQKNPSLAIYFAGIIVFVPIVLMNLVTAVIVENSVKQAQEDKELFRIQEEQRKEELVNKFRELFERLDDDNSGQVSQEELAQISQEDRQELIDTLSINDPQEVFKALDVDEIGQIDIDDLCKGILKVAVSNSPLEVQRMEKQVDSILARVQRLRSTQDGMHSRLEMALGVQQIMQGTVQRRQASRAGAAAGGGPGAPPAGRCQPDAARAATAPPYCGAPAADEGRALTAPPAACRAVAKASLRAAGDCSEAPVWARQLTARLRSLRGKKRPALRHAGTSDSEARGAARQPWRPQCPPDTSRPLLMVEEDERSSARECFAPAPRRIMEQL